VALRVRTCDDRSTAVGRGPAHIVGAEGELLAFAMAPSAIADDGTTGNSPFTPALLSNIETPSLDVSLPSRPVRAEVMAATEDQQLPWVHEALLGEFYFVPATETAAPTPSTSSGVDERAIELAAWKTIKGDEIEGRLPH
jgi:uncharacterized caspase-like protein